MVGAPDSSITCSAISSLHPDLRVEVCEHHALYALVFDHAAQLFWCRVVGDIKGLGKGAFVNEQVGPLRESCHARAGLRCLRSRPPHSLQLETGSNKADIPISHMSEYVRPSFI